MFLVIVTYTQSMDKIDAIRAKHREYLSEFYKKGIMLMSGPHKERNGAFGGILLGKFENLNEVQEFIKNDPYNLANAAEYEVIEFDAVLHNDILEDFLKS